MGLKLKDFIKGLIIAVGTSVLVVIQSSLSADALTFNWKQIGMAAVAGGLTYLGKNFFTDDTKVAVNTLTKEAEKTNKTFLITPTETVENPPN